MTTHLSDGNVPSRKITEIGMSPALTQVAYNLRSLMDRIHAQFPSSVRITLIVRTPDDTEADIIMTADEMIEIAAVIERRKTQEGTIL